MEDGSLVLLFICSFILERKSLRLREKDYNVSNEIRFLMDRNTYAEVNYQLIDKDIDFKSKCAGSNDDSFLETKSLINLFEKASASFLSEKNSSLFKKKVCERTLCGALMTEIYRQICCDKRYKHYYVDIEYNRNKGYVKIPCDLGLDDEKKNSRIFCDILLHSRGEQEIDNLICIEMKIGKPGKNCVNQINNDLDRMSKLTIMACEKRNVCGKVCGYKLGVEYIIDINRENVYIKYFKPHCRNIKYSVPRFDTYENVCKKFDYRMCKDRENGEWKRQ